MDVFGVLILVGFSVIGVSTEHHPPHTLNCLDCHRISDPHLCTVYRKCHHDEVCSTEVDYEQNNTVFTLSCKHNQECYEHSNRNNHGSSKCHECCNGHEGCNKHLCGQYLTPSSNVAYPEFSSGSTSHIKAHPGSFFCYKCDNIMDPKSCTTTQKCHHNEVCGTVVHYHFIANLFSLSCMRQEDCQQYAQVFGKRDDPSTLRCIKCCSHSSGCNRHLCSKKARLYY